MLRSASLLFDHLRMMPSNPRDGQLRRSLLLSYGLGSVAPTVAHEFCGAFVFLFYTELMHLDPIWVGYALLIRMIVDAVVDPVIGYVSDRTRCRSGRRRPYFLVGSSPGLVLLVLTFMPPEGSASFQFAYLAIISSLMAACFSVAAIPHMAMAFELSPLHHQRVRVVGYRNFIESLSSLLALLSGPIFLALAGMSFFGHQLARADCYRLGAVMIGISGLLATMVAFAGTAEGPPAADEGQYGFWHGVYSALRNQPFRTLLLVYVCLVVANRVALAQIFLLLEHFHGIKEEDTIPLLLSFYLGALSGTPVWSLIGTRVSQFRALVAAIILWPLSFVALVAFSSPGSLLMLITFGMGASFAGILLMLGTIAPTILDLDRIQSGKRREGLYASTINLVLQMGIGIGYLSTGVVLSLIGLNGSQPPTADMVLGLRFSTAGFPVFLACVALLFIWWRPIHLKTGTSHGLEH